jgi:GAF domain-containing protein
MTDRDDDAGHRPARLAGDPAGVDVVAAFEAEAALAAVRAPRREQRRLVDRLCQAVVNVVPVDAAAVSVHLGGDVTVPVGAAGRDAAAAEALQFSLAEGPCLQVYASGTPVLVPDVETPEASARWPAYAAELATHTHYRAVYAFPLLRAGRALGSLSLYRSRPGPMPVSPRSVTGLATLLTGHMLDAEVFAGLGGEVDHPWINGPTTHRRHQVWQAQGMIMSSNDLMPAQALDALRAHAYSAGRLVDDIAEEIVTRRSAVPLITDDE